MSGGAFVTTHRLRFNDTDRLGHVNNAVFAVMLEQGRSELMALAGLPIGTGEQSVVIVRLELDFVAEMTWPGDVRIETEIAHLGGRSFRLQQRLWMADTLCGRAVTVLVVMDRSCTPGRADRPLADQPRPLAGGPALLNETQADLLRQLEQLAKEAAPAPPVIVDPRPPSPPSAEGHRARMRARLLTAGPDAVAGP